MSKTISYTYIEDGQRTRTYEVTYRTPEIGTTFVYVDALNKRAASAVVRAGEHKAEIVKVVNVS